MCDMCHDDGYIEVDGEIIQCPMGCEPKAALTTDMQDASYEDDGYEYA